MKAEYQALSQSMRDRIPSIREILKEIIVVTVFNKAKLDVKFHAYSKSFEDTRTGGCKDVIILLSTVFEDIEACCLIARMPKLTPRTKHITVQYHWLVSKQRSREY